MTQALCESGIGSLRGRYTAELRDKHGNLKWESEGFNTIVNEGKNWLLDAVFDLDTPQQLYIGLVETALGGSFGVGTTAANIENAAHIPEFTSYDESTRQACNFGDPASQSITNSAAVAVFTFSVGVVDQVIPGVFLVTVSTKSSTTGELWAALNFTGGSATVDAGDTLRVTYTVTW